MKNKKENKKRNEGAIPAKPAPKAKPKPKGRGRPRVAAVPQPPAAPAVVTTAQAMLAMLQDAKERATTGKPLANHHTRILRDAWLLDMSAYVWPTSAAAAADLGISVGTFRSYAAQGCPGIEDHSPIAKHQVLAWLLRTAHDRGGKPGATINDAEELDNDLRRIKVARLSNALVTEAEDLANQGVIQRMGQLRHHLQNGLPGVLYETALKHHTDRTAGEDALSQLIDSELRRFEPRRATAIQTQIPLEGNPVSQIP